MLPSEEEIKEIIGEENVQEFIDYVKFILENRLTEYDNLTTEKHHIFPRALFPKYKKEDDNLAFLSFKNHVIAHYKLYKILPHNKKVVFALNLMINRGKFNPFFEASLLENQDILDDLCEQYRLFRLSVKQIISKTNKGRSATDEFRRKMSNITKNTVVVKDAQGNIFRVPCNDERYLKGELVYYRVGYEHNNKTKQLMSKNGIKNRRKITNGTIIKFIKKDEKLPDGFKYGSTDEEKLLAKNIFLGTTFIYNKETGETKRIKNTDDIPEGFTKERVKKGKFNGWDDINKYTVKVYDIRKKVIESINKNNFDENYQLAYPSPLVIIKDGVKTVLDINETIIIEYDNYYFYRTLDFKNYLCDTYKLLIPDEMCNSLHHFVEIYPTKKLTHLFLVRSFKEGFNEKWQGCDNFKVCDLLHLNFIRLKDTIADGSKKVYNSNETIRKLKNGY